MQDTLSGEGMKQPSHCAVVGIAFCSLLNSHANGKHPGQMLSSNQLKWHWKVNNFIIFLKHKEPMGFQGKSEKSYMP